MAYDKLVDSSALDSNLGDVADAIRAKSGGSSQLAFPSGFISEIGSISTGGGGIEYGVEFILDSNDKITNIIWHGDIVPDFGLNYWGWSINAIVASSVIPTLSFADHPTHIGASAFHNTTAHIDTTNLDLVETIGETNAFTLRCGTYLDHSSEVIHLPKYTGWRALGSTGSSDNLFRATDARMPKKYIMESLEVIPQYAWYGFTVTDMDVQLGSIGHAVQSSKSQPFGNTANASGTITIYTTGALLDAVKTGAQANSGANLTFIYKASEATTYNGTSYNAGDTMMTSTGA